MDSGFPTAIKQEIALTHLDDQIHDWGKATKPRGRRASFHEAATAPRTKSQVRISDTIPPQRIFICAVWRPSRCSSPGTSAPASGRSCLPTSGTSPNTSETSGFARTRRRPKPPDSSGSRSCSGAAQPDATSNRRHSLCCPRRNRRRAEGLCRCESQSRLGGGFRCRFQSFQAGPAHAPTRAASGD